MRILFYIFFILFPICFFSQSTYQTAVDTLNCQGGTTTFVVDLSSNPNTTWTSPPKSRAGNCCGTDNNCVQFRITLHPNAQGINFTIPTGCGASPSGALFYQVNCGPLTSVGTPLCLNGPGPYTLTFCKPGNNANCYSIASIPPPGTSGDIVTADGCQDTLSATGLIPSSVSWTSITPGTPGQYNNLLSNLTHTVNGVSGTPFTGVSNVIVTPNPSSPSSISYRVCGTVVGACSAGSYCDTVTVSVYPNLGASINPAVPVICYGQIGVNLTANPIGGTAPYAYSWTGPTSNGATSQTITATSPGLYTVSITDGTNCVIATHSVTVTQFTNPITANAGPDISTCGSLITNLSINGSVTGVSTGVWSGGTGTYSSSTTDLSLNYTLSPAEIAAGTVTLTLSTTGNGTCPPASDQVVISLNEFDA